MSELNDRFTAFWSRITHVSWRFHKRGTYWEQPLDFYELDVLPATQPIVSKHYRKTKWFDHLLFYRHGISTPCLTNSVKALKHHRLTGMKIYSIKLQKLVETLCPHYPCVVNQLLDYFNCCTATQVNHHHHHHFWLTSLKVGFHYPSSRPEFTGRVDGPRTRVHFLTPVNSGRQLG